MKLLLKCKSGPTFQWNAIRAGYFSYFDVYLEDSSNKGLQCLEGGPCNRDHHEQDGQPVGSMYVFSIYTYRAQRTSHVNT